MAKPVYIRFLKQGLVKAEVPDNFDSMTPKEKLNWAWERLSCLSDEDLIEALSDYQKPRCSQFFDDSPSAAAIEDATEENQGADIVHTNDWHAFAFSDNGMNVCEGCLAHVEQEG